MIDTDVAAIGVRLIDDAYMAWFRAETECTTTLRDWFEAIGARRKPRYLAYLAALDREEASARDLERLWCVASPCRAVLVKKIERVSE
jgi:hypothetical protein